jgi:hypothetical protein
MKVTQSFSVEIAKKNLGNKAELKVGDSEYMSWEDNSFDVFEDNSYLDLLHIFLIYIFYNQNKKKLVMRL